MRRLTALFAALALTLSAFAPAAAGGHSPGAAGFWCGTETPSAEALAAYRDILAAAGVKADAPQDVPAEPDCGACCALHGCHGAVRVDVFEARLEPLGVKAPAGVQAVDPVDERGPPVGGRAPPLV